MVGATGGVAEVCQAPEDLVEFEEEGVRCIVIHLSTHPATLFDVFPAVKDSGLHLVVDDAGDEGRLLLEDVAEDLDKGL
jgi:hypothetical protein